MCVYSYHEWDLSTWQCRLEHDETEVSPFLLCGVVISLDLIKQRKAGSHNYPLLSAIDASITYWETWPESFKSYSNLVL